MTISTRLSVVFVVAIVLLWTSVLAGRPLSAVQHACTKAAIIALSAPEVGTVGVPVVTSASVQPATGQPSCRVAEWILSYGDGDFLGGNGAVIVTNSHTYDAVGVYDIALTAQTISGVLSAPTDVRILISDLPPATAYGPQATIVCPANAVAVTPGASIQDAVTANAGATTFCLKAGVHQVASSIRPKTGNTFVGEYGAILDGTGWATTDDTQAAFRAHNEDIDNVTIRNLVIRNMPQHGIHAFRDFSSGWRIEYSEIHHCIVGIEIAPGTVVSHNTIHDNRNPAPNPSPGQRGGGYQGNGASGATFEYNEIARNAVEQKIANFAVNVTWRHNYVHHNDADGIWHDGTGTISGTVVEDNQIEANGRTGITFEVSAGATIRNNTILRNGGEGILIANSTDIDISGNTLTDNAIGVGYFQDCDRLGQPDLFNLSTHDNTVTVPTGGGAFAGGLTFLSTCTAANRTRFLDGTQRLTFARNTYIVPVVSGGYFLWESPKTWTEWQAIGHDLAGSISGR